MVIDYKGHRIFAFSDTHGMYRRISILADADILICAGDACEGFNPDDLQDFFAWYTSIPAKLRIFVPGNHDRIFNQEPARARNLIPGGVVYLENEGIEFDGIKFYSVPAKALSEDSSHYSCRCRFPHHPRSGLFLPGPGAGLQESLPIRCQRTPEVPHLRPRP